MTYTGAYGICGRGITCPQPPLCLTWTQGPNQIAFLGRGRRGYFPTLWLTDDPHHHHYRGRSMHDANDVDRLPTAESAATHRSTCSNTGDAQPETSSGPAPISARHP